jgi:tRNA pseudouridine38-40 synthase
MPNYKLTLEYDATGLLGWQKQPDGASVQSCLEEALFRMCGERVTAYCSGRTDQGVHALGQVASVMLPKAFVPYTLMQGMNYHLLQTTPEPAAISVLAVEEVPDDFHARFSAKRRYYRYRIINRRGALAIDRRYAWHVGVPLDHEAMQEATQYFIGHHDFTSFRASECQSKSPLKTLDALEVKREGELITIETNALSFLHHQVRNMVGTLKLIGAGKLPPESVKAMLAAKDRSAAGPTAPAEGLFFVRVEY